MSDLVGMVAEEPRLRVDVGEGKYTLILEQDGRFHALRHGEPWPARDLVGDKLVLVMAMEIQELRAREWWMRPTRAVLDQLVEPVAKGLYEADRDHEAVWPENDDDDGNRGDKGYVRITPREVVEEYRQRARDALAVVSHHFAAKPPV